MKTTAMQFLCLISALALFSITTVDAWGKLGHEIVGNLAWTLLPSKMQTKIRVALNATDPKRLCEEYCSPLAIVADWADRVRYFKPWSAPLHFIDVRDDLIVGGCPVSNRSSTCEFQYDRDCKQDICVAGAILNYTSQIQQLLRPVETNDVQRNSSLEESLKFLVHFIGDIHQVRIILLGKTSSLMFGDGFRSLFIVPERQTKEATPFIYTVLGTNV